MADIFISYKREEMPWAQGIAHALQAEGFSAFFDVASDGILVGESWDKRLERELAIAKAVVVLWSPNSISSDNVRDEARRAHQRGILCPAFIADCSAPLGLGTVQAVNLQYWRGERDHPEWRKLIDRGVRPMVSGTFQPSNSARAADPATFNSPAVLWSKLADSKDAAALRNFADSFPGTQEGFRARERASALEKAAADFAKLDKGNEAAIRAFVKEHPDHPQSLHLRVEAPKIRARGDWMAGGFLLVAIAIYLIVPSSIANPEHLFIAGALGLFVGAPVGWIVGAIVVAFRGY